MGFLPILLIFRTPLPDECEDFAANVFLAGLAVGHDALVRGQDGDAQSLHHAGHILTACINAQARLGNPAKALDNRGLALPVFEDNADVALLAVFDDLETLYISFIQQNLSDCFLHVGSRNIDRIMFCIVCISDTCQHVSDRIGDMHAVNLLLAQLCSYQLAFLTPGICPLYASSLKQMRQTPNLRR